MILDFKALRPLPQYPAYPPYHNGLYIEEYFYNFYKENKKKFDIINKTLIPIFWTNLYIHNTSNEIIQYFVDQLPSDRDYFTVSQFDDGIQQKLPPDTINFVAGGNMKGIPIPLICSPIPLHYIKPVEKDILCSFVGTFIDTDRYVCRKKLYEFFSIDSDFYFTDKRMWDRIVPQERLLEFFNITQRSRFTLCPRGYGLQSFRLYEVLQLNSIPVFVYDKPFFPFNDFIDWNEFCVLIHMDEIPNLKNIITKISEDRQQQMLIKGREIYNQYFTMEGMSKHILKTLENLK
jgi:hypothetical protein